MTARHQSLPTAVAVEVVKDVCARRRNVARARDRLRPSRAR